jgi:hypothetical protein
MIMVCAVARQEPGGITARLLRTNSARLMRRCWFLAQDRDGIG